LRYAQITLLFDLFRPRVLAFSSLKKIPHYKARDFKLSRTEKKKVITHVQLSQGTESVISRVEDFIIIYLQKQCLETGKKKVVIITKRAQPSNH